MGLRLDSASNVLYDAFVDEFEKIAGVKINLLPKKIASLIAFGLEVPRKALSSSLGSPPP